MNYKLLIRNDICCLYNHSQLINNIIDIYLNGKNKKGNEMKQYFSLHKKFPSDDYHSIKNLNLKIINQ